MVQDSIPSSVEVLGESLSTMEVDDVLETPPPVAATQAGRGLQPFNLTQIQATISAIFKRRTWAPQVQNGRSDRRTSVNEGTQKDILDVKDYSYDSLIYVLAGFFSFGSGIVRLGDLPLIDDDLLVVSRSISRPLDDFLALEAQVVLEGKIVQEGRSPDHPYFAGAIPVYTRPNCVTAFESPLEWNITVGTRSERDQVVDRMDLSTREMLKAYHPRILSELSPLKVTRFLSELSRYLLFCHQNGYLTIIEDPSTFLSSELSSQFLTKLPKSTGSDSISILGHLLEFFVAKFSDMTNVEIWFQELRGKGMAFPSGFVHQERAQLNEWLMERDNALRELLQHWEVGLLLRIFPQSLASTAALYRWFLPTVFITRSIRDQFRSENTPSCFMRLFIAVVREQRRYETSLTELFVLFRGSDSTRAGEKRRQNPVGSSQRDSSPPMKKSKPLNVVTVNNSTLTLRVPKLSREATPDQAQKWLVDNQFVDSNGRSLGKYCWRCGDPTHHSTDCKMIPVRGQETMYRPWGFVARSTSKSSLHSKRPARKVSLGFHFIILENSNLFSTSIVGPVESTNLLGGPYLTVEVREVSSQICIKTSILIDSGAGTNFISCYFMKNFFVKLKNNSLDLKASLPSTNKLSEDEKFSVTYSNGTEEVVDQAINLEIVINDVTLNLRFFIISTQAINICIGFEDARRHKLLSLIENSGISNSFVAPEELVEVPFDTQHTFNHLNISDADLFKEVLIDSKFINQEKMKSLLSSYKEIFIDDLANRCIKGYQARINLTDEDSLTRHKLRKFPEPLENYVSEEIQRLLVNKVIEPSTSKFYCGIVPVKKSLTEWRICQNYVELNKNTKDEFHPLPFISVSLDRLRDCIYFAKMDLRNGFYQIEIHPEDRYKTSFLVKDGLFQFLRMPFGLKNAPSIFQKIMEEILVGLAHRVCIVYIDDVLVYAKTEEELILNLKEVFERFRKFNVSLKGSKCQFGLTEINYLGHIINREGKRLSEDRVNQVLKLSNPSSFSELRTALGMSAAFQEYIENYATIVKPLTEKSGRKSKNLAFNLTPEMAASWSLIKEKVRDMALLHRIDSSLPLLVRTDASNRGVGAVLYQKDDERLLPVAYLSQAFSDVATRWSTYEQEAYACYLALFKWQDKLLGRRFILETDHRNLLYLKENSSPKVVRWRMFLQQFTFDFVHIPGKTNVVADALSRLLSNNNNNNLNSLSLNSENSLISSEREIDKVKDKYLNYIEGGVEDNSLLNLEPDKADEIIKEFHNSSKGHHSIATTIMMIKEAGFCFKNLKTSVRNFIKSCIICEKIKRSNVSLKVRRKHTYSSFPFERVQIDPIGPFPESEEGFQYIFVATCAFTRFVELAPSKTVSATDALRFITSSLISRYGVPLEIQTDQGTAFTSKLLGDLKKRYNLKHYLSVPHHPQTNGITERKNQEILKHLRALILEEDDDWVDKIGTVQRILNYSYSSAIDTYPARLLFGSDLLSSPEAEDFFEEDGSFTSSVYLEKKDKELKELLDRSRTYMQEFFEKELDRSNRRFKDLLKREFTVGSYVLLSYPDRPPNKLLAPWMGPMLVTSIEGDVIGVINLVTGKVKKVHAERVKPLFSTKRAAYERYAARDYVGMYIPEAIRAVHHLKKGPSKAVFRVKWLGYEQEDNRTHDELKDSSVFHDFVRNHKIMSKQANLWIPKKYMVTSSSPDDEIDAEVSDSE